MIIILIILLFISIYFLISNIKLKKEEREGLKLDAETRAKNDEIAKKNSELLIQSRNLQKDITTAYAELQKINEKRDSNAKTADIFYEESKQKASKAFEFQFELLEKQYKEKEQEYDLLNENIEKAYSNKQLELLSDLETIKAELDKLKASREATIAAFRKEQEIKDNLSFYCLNLDKNEIDDIKRLEAIKYSLHNPRVLSMLIWSNFFQKKTTKLCNDVLGTAVVCGIYKITNQLDGRIYIGQSVDVATRWKNHMKCGCDIDRPQGNKLYAAMVKEGLWNFSFELLEKCPREQLDEKEKFYIDLYKAKDYGYNSTAGNH